MPDELSIQGRRVGAAQDPVLVNLAPGRKTGVEFFRNPFGFSDRDIGREQTVQCPLPGIRIEPRFRFEIGCLPFCMDTGIGPPGPGQIDFFLCDRTDFIFDNALNGLCVGLPLPAMIGGSVVLQNKLDVRH